MKISGDEVKNWTTTHGISGTLVTSLSDSGNADTFIFTGIGYIDLKGIEI